MKRFADFAKEDIFLEGDKMRIDDILNQEIQVTGYRIKNSKFSKNESGKYLAIQFKQGESALKVLFTGSDVLVDQMGKYKEYIPFLTTIRKINRYYSFT